MKVLIVSHNPISTQSNMGKTFLSLFSQFSPEELCQLYIYPVIPNEERCSSYYRVTDKDVLNALVRFQKPGGVVSAERIAADQGLYEDAQDQSFYKSRKNKSAFRRLMRDVMWKIAPWYQDALRSWLEKEKPDCIFVAPGVAKFLYDIALRIAKERDIPIVSYICDEYYFVKEPRQWLDALRLRLLRKKIEQLMAKTQHLVVISEELRRAYADRFGVETTGIMTGAAITPAVAVKTTETPENICYFGNIRCNRYMVLAEIGRALDDINGRCGTNCCLKIYSAEKNPEILEAFQGIQSVKMCGFVIGEAFEKAFREADLLVHAEAFDEESMDFTQRSVSTKIADSLASGIPLVAYGPKDISSMAHLLRNHCAITALTQKELPNALQRALFDPDERRRVAENALGTAANYHDLHRNGILFRNVVEKAVGIRYDRDGCVML